MKQTHINLLREEMKREHELLNSRTNIFLLWQSILLAGYAGSFNEATKLVLLTYLCVGLISSVIWIYIGHISRMVVKKLWENTKELEENLPEEDRIYTESRKYRSKSKLRVFKLSVTKCFAYLFPTIWIIGWTILSLNELFK